MPRSLLIAIVLVLAGCASPNLPEAYRSKNLPGTINCTAYPQSPSPAACRNLYENTVHTAVDSTGLR
jgi:hypothetical protein